MARYFSILTMGCQMNEYDSDYLSQCLLDLGFQPGDDPLKADLILINTCTVREKAEQKALSMLGRMIRLKKKKPSLILGMVGCLAQQKGEFLARRFPELDLVLGTREIGRIAEILQGVGEKEGERAVVALGTARRPPPPKAEGGYFTGKVKSNVSVMEGCNNFCSYCIVPYVRGRETSRDPEDIINEIKRLIDQGVREVTLLGQNVNSYRYSGGERVDFPRLLQDVNGLNGLKRIRFTTSHPKDLSGRLIRCFGELEKLCPHIHLPVQAGSNQVLSKMNRRYTREDYIKLIGALRRARPGIAITSDVIVGFPGESENDFQLTLDLIREIGFDNIFSFQYSDRKGTLAEKMEGKVSEEEKGARLSQLQSVQRSITLNINRTLVGKNLEILVEGRSKKGERQLTGRTGTNKVVNFNHDNNIIGNIVSVKIKRAFFNSLWGERLDLPQV